jgi:hypothetical protein
VLFVTSLCPLGIDLSLEVDTFLQPVAARQFVQGAMLFVTALCPLGIDLSLEVDTFLQPVAARQFAQGAALFVTALCPLCDSLRAGLHPVARLHGACGRTGIVTFPISIKEGVCPPLFL